MLQLPPISKVLLIEDNLEFLHDIRYSPVREGNICEIARDYQTVRRKVGIFPYDILVIDITLPDGNGLDLTKEIKKDNVGVGIIISAKNTPGDKVHGLEVSAVH